MAAPLYRRWIGCLRIQFYGPQREPSPLAGAVALFTRRPRDVRSPLPLRQPAGSEKQWRDATTDAVIANDGTTEQLAKVATDLFGDAIAAQTREVAP